MYMFKDAKHVTAGHLFTDAILIRRTILLLLALCDPPVHAAQSFGLWKDFFES